MERTNLMEKERLQTIIAWFAYLFINVVFCVKYNPVDAIKPVYIILTFPVIALIMFRISCYKNIQRKNLFFILISVGIILLSFFLMQHIDKYSVDVDRWSALTYWSENLKNGEYPYGTPTHMGGYASPFPVWQIFHFPFYLLGDTGYGQLFCLTSFLIFLYVMRRNINIGSFVLLMAMSPCFWWEMAVRSDSLCNMFLVFIFISVLLYYPAIWDKYTYWVGLIVGLFLCTKLLASIPLFIYIFPRFISLKARRKFLFVAVVIAGLVVPFLPFLFGEKSILNHPEYNPMLAQTRQGSSWTILLGAILISWASLKSKTIRDCYFFSGLFLFLLILSVGIKIMLDNDLQYLIFGDEFDISYFTTSIPYWLFCINQIQSREDRVVR